MNLLDSTNIEGVRQSHILAGSNSVEIGGVLEVAVGQLFAPATATELAELIERTIYPAYAVIEHDTAHAEARRAAAQQVCDRIKDGSGTQIYVQWCEPRAVIIGREALIALGGFGLPTAGSDKSWLKEWVERAKLSRKVQICEYQRPWIATE